MALYQDVDRTLGRFARRMEVATAALAATVGVFMYVQVAQPFAYRPLRNVSPQIIQESTVAPGGVVHVVAIKCNDSRDEVPIEGQSYWIRVNGGTRKVVPYMTGAGVRTPGCKTLQFDNRVPIDLPRGTWRLEGIEIARDGARIQQVGWYTEEFEVTGGR